MTLNLSLSPVNRLPERNICVRFNEIQSKGAGDMERGKYHYVELLS